MKNRVSFFTARFFAIIAMGFIIAAPRVSVGQVTVFQDTFQSGGLSTLNPTATSPGTLTGTRTAYEIAASKSATSSTIASGVMTFGNFNTSSGYCEGQAMFTNSPITLTTPGQYIEVYYVFTDTTTLFNGNGGANEQINIGLYNSGGSPPTNGTALWTGTLATSSTTADVGCTKGWIGYNGMIAYSTNVAPVFNGEIYTRAAQAAANNSNQGLGANSSATLAGFITGVGALSQPALTVGNQYTLDLKIYYVSATSLLITNTLYVGNGTGGSVFSAGGITEQYGGSVSGANFLTNSFDSLCIGFRPTSNPTTAETMQINKVAVINYIPTAPTITGLTNRTVVAGTSPTLSPTISGAPVPTFQWQTNGVNIANATNASLTLNNVQSSQDGYVYSLIASNQVGSVTNNMTLSVIVTPNIAGLNNQSANTGDIVSISPTVTGVPTPTLQWQTNGVNLTDDGLKISGSQTSTLYITNAQPSDSGTYSLIASNSAGIVTNSMLLTVSSGNQLPAITGPTNITVIQGNNGTFNASASGSPVPTLQWLDQTGTPIPGATSSSLTLPNVQYSQNGFVYSVVASNIVASVTNSATLTVIVPPSISAQPTNLVVTNTQSASFSVTASGVPSNLAYQWNKNGSPISSTGNSTATNATFTIASASPNDTASYSCTITNQAGSTNTVSVTLTVNSTLAATTLAPANAATGICYDTPLYLIFSSTPVLRTAGTIKIYNITNSTTPVDTINLALNAGNGTQARSAFPGDGQAFNYYPVVITGTTAAIYPHSGVMTSNQTYYVTIDYGAFADTSGAFFAGIAATNAWQFSTKVGGPMNPANPVVNIDGSGDFVTVQGAIDSLALNAGGALRTINIKNGAYFEIVDITGKTNVTLRGQNRTATIIKYPNNASIATGGGTTHARMTFKVNANDVAIENLTISNSTPQGGSQAEALMIESAAKRCIVNNADIASRQDTILANVNSSQAFFYNSKIIGNFDYIWGGGNLYFNKCVLHTISGASGFNLTAARTDTSASPSANTPWINPNGTTYSANGFSFVNCTVEADSGVTGITLAGSNGTAGGLDSWIFCNIDTNAYVNPSFTLSTNYVFWQYQNTDITGINSISYTNLVTIGVTNNDPRLLAATNVTTWFYGWTPQLAPNITSQPANQSVSAGQATTFAVTATGFPNPVYQWLQNGSPISGATGTNYTIASAVRANAGNYSVIVSNISGSITSSVATLTYTGNVAPVAGSVFTNYVTMGVASTVQIVGGKYGPSDADGDALVIGITGAAANGTGITDGTNITYTATNGTSDSLTYTVNDGNGGSASQTIYYVISAAQTQSPNQLSAGMSGGQEVLNFAGIPGYNYALDEAHDLTPPVNWTPVTTNMAATNGIIGSLSFTNTPSGGSDFYRTRYVP